MKILIIIDFRPRLLRAWALGQKTLARRWAWDFEVRKREDHAGQKYFTGNLSLHDFHCAVLINYYQESKPSAALVSFDQAL